MRWRALRESEAAVDCARGERLSCETVRSCATVALRFRAPKTRAARAALRREGRAPFGFGFVGVPLNTHFRGAAMAYRCEATSFEGFIQQLAVAYLPHGYWFCVAGEVPAGKDPRAVDRKLIERYEVDLSRWARARRKKAGGANVHYLRWDRSFVLLATHGHHRFFEEERESVFDVRRAPIRVGGYAVSFRQGHAHVRLDQERYRELKAYFLELATHRTASTLAEELRALPVEPYAPVRRQLFIILRAVNRSRRAAGFQLVPWTALRLRRRILRPFEPCPGAEPATCGGRVSADQVDGAGMASCARTLRSEEETSLRAETSDSGPDCRSSR